MHILVATGGSPHSQTALHLTGTLAAATGANVTLLTVATSEAHRANAETVSLHAAAALREWVAEVETRLSVGPTAASILSEASARNYDLLVIGERRGHRLIHRIVASTVERLTERAPCPVLVARSAGLPGRILICESSRRPLVTQRLVDKLAPIVDICRQATLLHVMSQIAAGPGVAGEDLRDDAERHIQRETPEGRLLREGADVLANAGVSARPRLRHGRVVDEVVAETRDEVYDLIVIGAFRATGWDRMMLSDQARAILAGTHEPLLVL